MLTPARLRFGGRWARAGVMIPARVYWHWLKPHWPHDDFFRRNPAFPGYPREWDDFVRWMWAHPEHPQRPACLYPDVPRSHHRRDPAPPPAGPHSTTGALQRERFDGMRLASGVHGAVNIAMHTSAAAYDAWLTQQLRTGWRIATAEPRVLAAQLPAAPANVTAAAEAALVLFCADCRAGSGGAPAPPSGDGWAELLVRQLGLLARGPDGVVRGHYRGVVGLRWLGRRLWIVAADSPLADAAAQAVAAPPVTPGQPTLLDTARLVAGGPGDSCADACAPAACDDGLLPLANACAVLSEHFGASAGTPCDEAPSDADVGAAAFPGKGTDGRLYLGHVAQMRCDARVPNVLRMCVCMP